MDYAGWFRDSLFLVSQHMHHLVFPPQAVVWSHFISPDGFGYGEDMQGDSTVDAILGGCIIAHLDIMFLHPATQRVNGFIYLKGALIFGCMVLGMACLVVFRHRSTGGPLKVGALGRILWQQRCCLHAHIPQLQGIYQWSQQISMHGSGLSVELSPLRGRETT